MTCAFCGSPNAMDTCYRCEAWLCEECAKEYDGYIVCKACYAECSGEKGDDDSHAEDLVLEEEDGDGDDFR